MEIQEISSLADRPNNFQVFAMCQAHALSHLMDKT